MIKFSVPDDLGLSKIDECIFEMLGDVPLSVIKKCLSRGEVRLNGQRQKKICPVYCGDLIEIYLPFSYEEYQHTLDIIYEDKNLIIVNKHPGISVYEQQGQNPTIQTLCEAYLRESGEYSPATGCMPLFCNFVDPLIGGLVIISKNDDVYRFIREALAQRRIRKFYYALVDGTPNPPEDELTAHLTPQNGSTKACLHPSLVRGSVHAAVRYQVVKPGDGFSLVQIEPVTDYAGQIYVFMQDIGNPILGDQQYGNAKRNKELAILYPALWGYRLLFETGKNHFLEYLDQKDFRTNKIVFPYLPFEEPA